MPIRFATAKDEPAIVDLFAAAFFDEDLMGTYIHPYRHQYPDDIKIWWHNWFREDFADRQSRVIVVTLIENGEEKVVGAATWQRKGEDEAAQKIISTWKDPGEFIPLASTHNRAIEPSRETCLADSYPYFEHFWQGTTNGVPRAENWYLNICAVHPSYQKRGIGQDLVKWGIDRAREEKVHASVLASDKSGRLYLNCGFDEIVGNCTHGEGNPIAGVPGGDILFMWAKH
ncbi:acyl-CoA N-acyltransferase [Phaeosphaeriaceae sp. PMI808]|nr:acyl-CoA N-acyltransferase [Phaeosphaeriaceae sp. PMI808]